MNNTQKNTNAPENTPDMGKAWDLLTDEQKANLILVNAVIKQNKEQERIENAEAPEHYVVEV